MEKEILYVDLDGVSANFDARRDELKLQRCPEGTSTKVPKGFFENLDPIEGAVESILELSKYYEIYFLSTPQWSNPDSYTEKRVWVEKHFGEWAEKRLTLTHQKYLSIGDYLVDDRNSHGNEKFTGELVHFGTDRFPNWDAVKEYLMRKHHRREVKEMFPSAI